MLSHTSTLALLLIIIHLIGTTTTTTKFTNANTIPPFQNGVPGSGYGCNTKCDDGDVNYVIRASLQTYPLHLPAYNQEGGMNVSMFTRTFEGVAEER